MPYKRKRIGTFGKPQVMSTDFGSFRPKVSVPKSRKSPRVRKPKYRRTY